jgi:hypothetical protein
MPGKGRPFPKGVRGGPGRSKGTPNKNTQEIRDFAQKLLTDPAYVRALEIRLLRGTAGAVEPLLYHYGWGKPKETVSVEGSMPMPLVIELVKDRRQLGESDPDAGDDADDE